MANRLSREPSPYLRQHEENPVDWFPWGEEAFEKAARDQKPIFLSIGYASCHWCHVMAHESFEDSEIAEILNRSYVSVKVDREERPDVDETYMAAVQMQSGRGGWPMSVFLTPERLPLFAGTYFPKEDMQGRAGFRSLLLAIEDEWRLRRQDLDRAAAEFGASLREALESSAPIRGGELDARAVDGTVRALSAHFDRKFGGFGSAPKFPSHAAMLFLSSYAKSAAAPPDLAESAREMLLASLRAMALGGIHDHVGGGFHRYSTDERWLVPHFEKMLYDNALLLECLIASEAGTEGALLKPLLSDARDGIVRWLNDEMLSPDGLFYAAIDADSEGEEGKYYVWTLGEVEALLGTAAGPFLTAYGVAAEGNFSDESTRRRTGANILHLDAEPARGFHAELEALRAARSARPRPQTDVKCLIAWNGLAISALAAAGERRMALRAGEAVVRFEAELGYLPHQVVDGVPSGRAFLDGYAASGLAAISLFRATGDSAWRALAARWCAEMLSLFGAGADGALFYSSESHERLIGRTKPALDQPIPSPNSLAARLLIELGQSARAAGILSELFGWMERAPTATEGLWLAALEMLSAPGAIRAPMATRSKRPTARLSELELVPSADGWGRGEVVIELPHGLHVDGPNPPVKWLRPLEVVIESVESELSFPPAPEAGYVGTIRVGFGVRLPAGTDRADFTISVSLQACSESECLEPQAFRLAGTIIRG